jgi:hypothetical protein
MQEVVVAIHADGSRSETPVTLDTYWSTRKTLAARPDVALLLWTSGRDQYVFFVEHLMHRRRADVPAIMASADPSAVFAAHPWRYFVRHVDETDKDVTLKEWDEPRPRGR